MIRLSTCFLLLTALLFPLHGFAQDVVVLEGGTLIDGTGKAPVNDAVVVIEGNRIKAVGVKGKVSYPQNARVIKTDGRTILPGLIDGHIHLKEYMPPMFLHYGVTTVGDTNNHTEWSLQEREALRTGKMKGPRLFISGVAAGGAPAEGGKIRDQEKKGGFDTYNRTGSDGTPLFSVNLHTVDEARAYTKSLLAQHMDMIKVDLGLTQDQLRAIIEEATKSGVAVVGHSQNIEKAAGVGLKYMEHTDTLGRAILEEMGGPEKVKEGGANPERLMDTARFDALIKYMVKQGVYLNPTMIPRWRSSTPRGAEIAKVGAEVAKDPGLAFVPAEVKESWGKPGGRADDVAYKKVAEFLKKYSEAGGKVIAATDAGILPGLSLHYEMQLLNDVGIPNMKVIQSATLWGAEAIGEAKNLGSVEPGKLADFTIIEGNPLTDIAATKNVRMVIKDGKVVDTAYDPKFKNPYPRPTWPAATTADGHPDLQGIWTNPTITPFERPVALGNKQFLTEKEAADLEKQVAASKNDEAPPQPGDVGAYNQFWFDSGTKVVSTRQTSLVVDPPDGRVPLKPSAEARRDYDAAHITDSWEHMSVWDRCITRGVPAGMFPAGYNNAYQIVQIPGYVVFLYEMIHEARVIPVDGRPHLPQSVRQWNGDSVGRWEGNTLVVDTTNYNGKGWIATSAATGRIKGIPQSQNLHVVERFTRVDADTIQYEATIDDPENYTHPWKVAIPLERDPSYQIFEYACHEGNHAVENVLSGGRAQDKAAQKGSK